MADTNDKATQAPDGAPAGSAAADKQLTCFVVTGFGNKTDYATGRVLNLNKTFELLVRPACDALGINCFRAIDVNTTGSINSVMYHWIYAADLVIADLSTLNANAFYELGVRHALKPNTTFLIAESDLLRRIPFDLGTFVIHKYDHGGDTITEDVQSAFVAQLSAVMAKALHAEPVSPGAAPALKPLTDSPVFTYLQGLVPASYQAGSAMPPPPYVPPGLRPPKGQEPGESLAALIARAEKAKDDKRFADAIDGFQAALKRQMTSDDGKPSIPPDRFLVQRLALVTYKHGERAAPGQPLDKVVAVQALRDAWAILKKDCEPESTNDPETLGLAGAIHKRLFDHLGRIDDLNTSIWFYERGFYVKRDYYNGINVAYMYTLRATLLGNRFDAIVSYGHANLVRRQVVAICTGLMGNPDVFKARGDKAWIVLSLAEAHLGLGETAQVEALGPQIASLASPFALDTYAQQTARLRSLMDQFGLTMKPEELQTKAAPEATVPVSGGAAVSGHPVVRPFAPGQAIVIDANLAPGRSIRSVEVSCKIDYD